MALKAKNGGPDQIKSNKSKRRLSLICVELGHAIAIYNKSVIIKIREIALSGGTLKAITSALRLMSRLMLTKVLA